MTTEELPAELVASRTPDDQLDLGAQTLSIADVAARLGISPHTIRYYEREGLVKPLRDAGERRWFEASHLRRLEFLRRMRRSGMGMSALRRYVGLVEDGSHTEPQRLEMMLTHRETIRRQLHELHLALAATEYKITTYGGALGDGSVAASATKEKNDDRTA